MVATLTPGRLALSLPRGSLVLRSLRSGTGTGTEIASAPRRAFRWSACRREQFLDADKDTFVRAVTGEGSKNKLVLVDFYANWCGPCKMLSPILEKLTAPSDAAQSTQTQTGSGLPLDLVTINTDEQPELAMEYNVRSLPTVLAFKDGKVVNQFVGALPEPHVKKFISQL